MTTTTTAKTTLTDVTGREPLPDAVAELMESSRTLGDLVERVWRLLPAADRDGTPPERGVSVRSLMALTGENRRRIENGVLSRLRQAGVVERQLTHTRGVRVAYYRTDTVDPLFADARRECERERATSPTYLLPSPRRVRPGGPSIEDPFAVDPDGLAFGGAGGD
ncbi:hypothetical protein [Halococcus sediminicola]|uniref:hypothetical protein n=1 Tax=Halococcus sediminicola TaxID=1264579 RepID=UPI0006790D2E|nr:hypothetical protein [Halococcus sediminicola]